MLEDEAVLVGEEDDSKTLVIEGAQLGSDSRVPPLPVGGIVAELFARGGGDEGAIEVKGSDPCSLHGGIFGAVLCRSVVASKQQSGRAVVGGVLGPVDLGADVWFLGGGSEEAGNGTFWEVGGPARSACRMGRERLNCTLHLLVTLLWIWALRLTGGGEMDGSLVSSAGRLDNEEGIAVSCGCVLDRLGQRLDFGRGDAMVAIGREDGVVRR